MFGLVRGFLGRMRYRRRWGVIAAAAAAAADSATAEANRQDRGRDGANRRRLSGDRAADAGGRHMARTARR